MFFNLERDSWGTLHIQQKVSPTCHNGGLIARRLIDGVRIAYVPGASNSVTGFAALVTTRAVVEELPFLVHF